MTVIAGVAHEGTVYMAADTASSSEQVEVDLVAPKIFTIGEMLVGVSGTTRALDLIRLSPEIIGMEKRALVGPHDKAHHINELIIKTLTEAGCVEEEGPRYEALAGIEGRLFQLSLSGVIESVHGHDAVGCAQEPAIGSLITTGWSREAPCARVAIAVRVAIELNPRAGGRVFSAQLPEAVEP